MREQRPAAAGSRPTFWQSVAGYLALRIVLFLVVAVVLRLLGLTGLVLVIVSLLVSGVLALPLARRRRDEVVARARSNRRR